MKWSLHHSSLDALNLTGHSAMLAAILAAVDSRRGLRAPWKDSRQIWATGLVDHALTVDRVDSEGFARKLDSFAASKTEGIVLFAPTRNDPEDVLRHSPQLKSVGFTTLARAADRVREMRGTGKLVVSVDEGELPALLEVLFDISKDANYRGPPLTFSDPSSLAEIAQQKSMRMEAPVERDGGEKSPRQTETRRAISTAPPAISSLFSTDSNRRDAPPTLPTSANSAQSTSSTSQQSSHGPQRRRPWLRRLLGALGIFLLLGLAFTGWGVLGASRPDASPSLPVDALILDHRDGGASRTLPATDTGLLPSGDSGLSSAPETPCRHEGHYHVCMAQLNGRVFSHTWRATTLERVLWDGRRTDEPVVAGVRTLSFEWVQVLESPRGSQLRLARPMREDLGYPGSRRDSFFLCVEATSGAFQFCGGVRVDTDPYFPTVPYAFLREFQYPDTPLHEVDAMLGVDLRDVHGIPIRTPQEHFDVVWSSRGINGVFDLIIHSTNDNIREHDYNLPGFNTNSPRGRRMLHLRELPAYGRVGVTLPPTLTSIPAIEACMVSRDRRFQFCQQLHKNIHSCQSSRCWTPLDSVPLDH